VDSLALAAIAVAAVMHAAWNILLKTAGDPLRTATIGVSAASIVLVPVVAAGWLALGQPSIRTETWVIGIVSGAVEVLYFVFLASAYGRGDLSVVYPLARGSAPLLAIVLGVELAAALYRLYPGKFQLDRTVGMIGSRQVLQAIKNGDDPQVIQRRWQPGLDAFCRLRAKYLLY
jgi:hypothetical protein